MEPEAEPWEALALDLEFEDSNHVLCKRKNSVSPTRIDKTFPSSSSLFLGHCSNKRLIPGPARAVQSAMQHRISMAVGAIDDEPVSTQELIRRAVEDPGLEDEDFSRNPWLYAVDFVRCQGLVGDDGVAIGTPLSLINNSFNAERVPQIVAIVKSTTLNGLGDMMATLKDPTGTVDASIHRRVLTEGEFGKDISVGAVLILCKVAVFSPTRSACYLNVTVSNIVKVISKDTETSLQPNYPSLMVKHASADDDSGEKSWMSNKASSQSQEQVEGIMNCRRQNASQGGSVQNKKQMEKVILSPPCCFHGAVGNGQNSVVEELLVPRQDILDGLKVAVGTGSNHDDRENLLDEHPHPSNQSTRTGIVNYFRSNALVRGNVQNTEQLGNVNPAPTSSFGGDGGSRIQNSVAEKESFLATQNVDSTKAVGGKGTCGKDTSILFGNQLKPSNQEVRCNLLEDLRCNSDSANFIKVAGNKEDGNADRVKDHSQQLISKRSLSQWTDEQLDKLLSFD